MQCGRTGGNRSFRGCHGYYDGLGGTETSASSWEIAEITDTPAILVLDCKGASLSAAAIASGFYISGKAIFPE